MHKNTGEKKDLDPVRWSHPLAFYREVDGGQRAGFFFLTPFSENGMRGLVYRD